MNAREKVAAYIKKAAITVGQGQDNEGYFILIGMNGRQYELRGPNADAFRREYAAIPKPQDQVNNLVVKFMDKLQPYRKTQAQPTPKPQRTVNTPSPAGQPDINSWLKKQQSASKIAATSAPGVALTFDIGDEVKGRLGGGQIISGEVVDINAEKGTATIDNGKVQREVPFDSIITEAEHRVKVHENIEQAKRERVEELKQRNRGIEVSTMTGDYAGMATQLQSMGYKLTLKYKDTAFLEKAAEEYALWTGGEELPDDGSVKEYPTAYGREWSLEYRYEDGMDQPFPLEPMGTHGGRRSEKPIGLTTKGNKVVVNYPEIISELIRNGLRLQGSASTQELRASTEYWEQASSWGKFTTAELEVIASEIRHSKKADAAPVLPGEIKHSESANVNAMREAIETQAEMEVGKPIQEKQVEVQNAEADSGVERTDGVTIPKGQAGTQIIINIAKEAVERGNKAMKTAKGKTKTAIVGQFSEPSEEAIQIFDNGGKTADRYTIIFMGTEHEGMGGGTLYDAVAAGEDVTSPLGFYQHTEASLGKHLGKRIGWSELPEPLQSRISQELIEMSDGHMKDPEWVEEQARKIQEEEDLEEDLQNKEGGSVTNDSATGAMGGTDIDSVTPLISATAAISSKTRDINIGELQALPTGRAAQFGAYNIQRQKMNFYVVSQSGQQVMSGTAQQVLQWLPKARMASSEEFPIPEDRQQRAKALADKLMQLDNAIWDKLHINSGSQLKGNPSLMNKYRAEWKRVNPTKVTPLVLEQLENENFHSVVQVLRELKKAGGKKAFRSLGRECDNCETPLGEDDFSSPGSWSYTCPSCGFRYNHGGDLRAQLKKFEANGGEIVGDRAWSMTHEGSKTAGDGQPGYDEPWEDEKSCKHESLNSKGQCMACGARFTPEEYNSLKGKNAGFNFYFPGQVLREFYPEIQHELVDYPNATNSPMIEDVDVVTAAVEASMDTTKLAFISTSPAGGALGRDGKPEVLEGAPLRKENDIRGGMFMDEFYQNYEAGPDGDALSIVSHKVAAEDESKQFGTFLKRVCGEIARTLLTGFTVTSRPLMDQVPGLGEVQLAQVEKAQPGFMPVDASLVDPASRVKYLLEKLNDSDIKKAIDDAWARAAVWHDQPEGGFVYEVFVRAESIDTDTMVMKYEFVVGTREAK